jgi:hypothetical protein
MATFQFRLARVLEWYQKRTRLEEDRIRVLLADLERMTAGIANIRASREAVEKSLLNEGSMQAADFLALSGYRQRSRREEGALEQTRTRTEGVLVEQRARVKALRTRVRLLEKLRERRIAEFRLAEDHELEELAADSFRAAAFRANLPHA